MAMMKKDNTIRKNFRINTQTNQEWQEIVEYYKKYSDTDANNTHENYIFKQIVNCFYTTKIQSQQQQRQAKKSLLTRLFCYLCKQ